jgi:hypothetical protein
MYLLSVYEAAIHVASARGEPAGQCCGSGIFFLSLIRNLSIPDPVSKNSKKDEGEKTYCLTFFCSPKFQKVVQKFLNRYRKNFLSYRN